MTRGLGPSSTVLPNSKELEEAEEKNKKPSSSSHVVNILGSTSSEQKDNERGSMTTQTPDNNSENSDPISVPEPIPAVEGRKIKFGATETASVVSGSTMATINNPSTLDLPEVPGQTSRLNKGNNNKGNGKGNNNKGKG